jgi:hypothetical protein
MRPMLPVMAVLLTSGCGYQGQPQPPLANVPARVTGLSATQRGSELVVQFAPPQVTMEGFPIKQPLHLDVRAGPGNQPFDEEDWAAAARKLSPTPAAHGLSDYEMPVTGWAGKELTVGVRAIGSNGKEAPWMFVTAPIVASPQPPSALEVENTAAGVRLNWSYAGNPADTVFRVFRKTDAGDFAAVADVPKPPWTDPTSQFGQNYTYQVQTIVKLGEDHEAESEPSAELEITPKDIFPPAAPSGLQIAAAPDYFELSWNGNTEPDLASYRVYRSVSGGPFEQVAEVQLPAFSDRAVERGKLYRYEVTAVDRMGNESRRSNPVEVRLQ